MRAEQLRVITNYYWTDLEKGFWFELDLNYKYKSCLNKRISSHVHEPRKKRQQRGFLLEYYLHQVVDPDPFMVFRETERENHYQNPMNFILPKRACKSWI